MCEVNPNRITTFPGAPLHVKGKQGEFTFTCDGALEAPLKDLVDSRAATLTPDPRLLEFALKQHANVMGAGWRQKPASATQAQLEYVGEGFKQKAFVDTVNLPGRDTMGRITVITTPDSPVKGIVSQTIGYGFDWKNGEVTSRSMDEYLLLDGSQESITQI